MSFSKIGKTRKWADLQDGGGGREELTSLNYFHGIFCTFYSHRVLSKLYASD